MELVLRTFAGHVALAAELVCVLCIAIGAILTLIRMGAAMVRREFSQTGVRREVWRTLAVWLIMALEFALAADVVRSAIAPSWTDIGQLAAIAAIRTALNYFLERDLEAFAPPEDKAA